MNFAFVHCYSRLEFLKVQLVHSVDAKSFLQVTFLVVAIARIMGGHPREGLNVISHILKVDIRHFLRPVAMLPMHVWFADCTPAEILDPGVPNTVNTEKGLLADVDPSVNGGDNKILKRGQFFPWLVFCRSQFPSSSTLFYIRSNNKTPQILVL